MSDKNCTVIVSETDTVTVSLPRYEEMCRRSAYLDMIFVSLNMGYDSDLRKVVSNIQALVSGKVKDESGEDEEDA